jgi:hypothetical protein
MLDDHGLRTLLRRVRPTTTIAVVGSSGNLLGHAHGAAIDSHELIMRINNAPVAGYELDVGSDTHMRLSYCPELNQLLAAHLAGPNETILVRNGCSGPEDYAALAQWEANGQVVRMHSEWRDWLLTLVGPGPTDTGATPLEASSGFVGVALAIAITQHVGAPPPSVYGFGACEACGKYFACDSPRARTEALGQNAHHPFGREQDLLRSSWHVQGLIRFVEAWC